MGASEGKSSLGILFGFLEEAEEVAANGAAEWVLGLPLELPQVPALLLRPSHPGLHQRCHAALSAVCLSFLIFGALHFVLATSDEVNRRILAWLVIKWEGAMSPTIVQFLTFRGCFS